MTDMIANDWRLGKTSIYRQRIPMVGRRFASCRR